MRRKDFIKTAGLATAAVAIAPYILPSGRLFAATGTRVANHVVFALFGGGLRNQETVLQQYLTNQGLATQGNILPNILSGKAPSQNLVYTPWSPLLSNSIASQGTLFKEVLYKTGPTGHFNGHTVAMTGKYTSTNLDLGVNPDFPTIFEYYRKHSDPTKSALNAWWISEGLGPYPNLNYSRHPQYGALYGANYFNPATAFSENGRKYFSNLDNPQPDDIKRVEKMKSFLDNAFSGSAVTKEGIKNLEEDQNRIKLFIRSTVDRLYSGKINFAIPASAAFSDVDGDIVNLTLAWEVLNEFTPELMVVNTFNSDICHSDFSSYIKNIHKADYAIGWLWDKIQTNPKLKDDTILICMPEHGRNSEPNTLFDSNGFKAYDHTSDDNSRKVFAVIAGPKGKIKVQNLDTSTSKPETVDIVPTIAHILGFHQDIPSGLLDGRILKEAFV